MDSLLTKKQNYWQATTFLPAPYKEDVWQCDKKHLAIKLVRPKAMKMSSSWRSR